MAKWKDMMKDETLRKLYYSWTGIRRREFGKCFKDSDRHKKIYKNISVAPEWKCWEIYKNWALTHGYKAGLTLDRIDNTKGYSPENCRWVSREENNRNKRNVKFIMFNNTFLTIGQIGNLVGLDSDIIRSRLKRGWSLEKAIKSNKFESVEEKKAKTRERNLIIKKEYDSGISIKQLAQKYLMCERNIYDCIKQI